MAGGFRFQRRCKLRSNNRRNNKKSSTRPRFLRREQSREKFITTNKKLTCFFITSVNNNNKIAQNPKLEEQKEHKGLSLDPHRNHHHLHHPDHHQFHHQNPRNVDEEERESRQQQPFPSPQLQQQPSPPPQQPFNHQFYLQQSQSGQQLRDLYSRLEPQNFVPISQSQHPIKKRSYLTSSSSSLPAGTQHVRQKASMGDSSLQQQPASTRTALRKAGVGEIVEVQGGHIVRATGRKDRHSKVCTAKGPRDRRVRLSAHTAIQFYDVQDRLGYDRPSKAVDWLIKKAKAAIDELEQLPAWSPSSMNVSTSNRRRGGKISVGDVVAELQEEKGGGSAEGMYGGEEQRQSYNNANSSSSSLLPPSLDSDAIADTIKSFFPMGGGNAGPTTTSSASESPMHFEDYPQGELLQRSGGGGGSGNDDGNLRQSQDLKLSLQSFQDPILMHHSHSHHHGASAAHDEQQHSLFPGAVPIGFENPNTGWADSQHQSSPELGRLHRLVVGWNTQHSGTEHHGVGASSGSGSGGGFVFNQPSPLLQPLFGGGQHSQFFTQRGPLQSSNTPSIRAWISDPSFSIASSSEHHNHYHQAIAVHPQALSGLGFTSGEFSGFHIPTRIQGEEEHDGDHNRPSSASSGSHH